MTQNIETSGSEQKCVICGGIATDPVVEKRYCNIHFQEMMHWVQMKGKEFNISIKVRTAEGGEYIVSHPDSMQPGNICGRILIIKDNRDNCMHIVAILFKVMDWDEMVEVAPFSDEDRRPLDLSGVFYYLIMNLINTLASGKNQKYELSILFTENMAFYEGEFKD